ncbi:MarR family winged helix-turn-helix transcriptional regulator [Methylorubrum thiocyanatum]|uniref:MarR family winged helix-turn-helix transcriptional regulator n=1 Tax=Methylorubrum thiocyanatum TaxID=47958 RepID=UPI003F822949
MVSQSSVTVRAALAVNKLSREPVRKTNSFSNELVQYVPWEAAIPEIVPPMLPAVSEEAEKRDAVRAASYVSLDALIGDLARRNAEVMSSAFALSSNRMHQKVLWHLSKFGPKTSKELAEKTRISKGKISDIVNELYLAGIIEKTQGKRGSEPLHIRKEIRVHFRRHADHVERLVRSAFNVLSEEERQGLHEALSRVLARLNSIGAEINSKPSIYIESRGSVVTLPSPQDSGTNEDNAQSTDSDKDPAHVDERSSDDGHVLAVIERQARILVETTERITHYKVQK